ncbi:hypothetical protein [uncultured Akkermansia sp.]|uniref:hypothetical protein n=1 Tax=uncultured Akkermansia sp. TaxID=512294 RepID=UPI0026396ED9|nr:hypothetical protein [uncultured Akkermansia sp.]
MEMTPEQKAFYEYGQARGILKERKELMISMEGEFDAAIYYPEYRELYHIEEAIRDAWQKRAACRAWVPLEKRECRTCSYLEEDDGSEICENCMIFNSLASSCNWEPRKEGE